MRRLLSGALACFALSAVLQAAPTCASLPTQQLSSYIAAGAAGCDVGGYNFSHFDWLAVGVAANVNNVDPNTITLNPSDTSGGPQLDVDLNWSTINAALPSAAGATLAFRVVSNNPALFLIESSSLLVNASSSGILGTAAVTETNCVGGLFTGNLCLSPGGLGTTGSVGVGGAVNFGAGSFVGVAPFNGPVTTIDILKTFTIATPGVNSSVTLSSVTEGFGAAAPEPATWVLLATSLLFIWVKRARFTSI